MCIKRRKYPQGKIRKKEGEEAIINAVNKGLIYGMIHLQWQPDILCINGSKYCYDHIVHSMASVKMQQLGMTAQPMKYILGKLQDLEHRIRTAYGTWESFMKND